jgi:uncharacterized protein
VGAAVLEVVARAVAGNNYGQPMITTLIFSVRRVVFVISAALFFSFTFAGTKVFAQKAIPELWAQRVHDETKSLSSGTTDRLEKQLQAYEDSTTNQIAILIINSLDGQPIEDYSIKVAEQWKLGTKKNDNGVILIIAIDDHAMRIEVGKGLEGVLTDAISSEIIRNEMAPNFRRGDYDAGVQEAVNSIIKAIGGEYKSSNVGARSNDDSLGTKIFNAAFIFGLLGVFTPVAFFGSGCSGWGLYTFLIPCYAFFPWIVIGALAGKILFGVYLIGFPIGKIWMGRTKWGKAQIAEWKKNKSTGGGRGGGLGWLALGGSLLGGGGGSGGFFGGGGGFGGGGASGSW